jgi:predicted RNase H-like HicB family nuclease
VFAFLAHLVFANAFCDTRDMELVFTVTQEADGGFVAECLSHDIFTQGGTWEELRTNVREAVTGYFFDQPKPSAVRLHLVRDEVLAVG